MIDKLKDMYINLINIWIYRGLFTTIRACKFNKMLLIVLFTIFETFISIKTFISSTLHVLLYYI